MNKQRCKWLGLLVLSLATLLVMGGCGGGSSSSSQQPVVAKASINGSVTFPSLNSLVGKQVAKSAAAAVSTPTVELRDLSGKVVATMTATGTGTPADPYRYSFSGIDSADYVVKAISGSKIVKALVDKNSLVTATTRNIDTISTTTLIVAEKKLGATLGTIGESAGAAITSNAIATVNPAALEGSINTAVNMVQYSAGTATQANIDLVNLVNVVSATVNNDVDSAKFIAGAATLPATVTTTQYTVSTVTTGGSQTAIVQATVSTSLQNTANAYTAPPSNSVSYIEKVYDFTTTPTGVPLSGVAVTTVGLSPEITTITDANGLFILPGIPQNASFYVKMSKSTYADSYSHTFSLTGNLDTTDRPYALFLPANLTGMGNSAGNGVIRSRVVVSTEPVTGYIGGAVVTATDKANGTTYPVKYVDSNGGLSSTLTATNSANGQYVIVNVPDGRSVDVTATKTGYTFNTKTFTVKADAVSMSRVVGTAVATPPATTSALKDSLISGWYEIRSDNTFNQTTITNTNYFSAERIGLAADGVTLTNTIASYYDRASNTWTSTIPIGFPTSNNSIDYTLTSAGVWINDSNGPQGYTAVFNADGTARVTNPASGELIDVSVNTVNISGQAISADGLDGALPNSTAAAYPSGSVRYNLTITSLADSYQLWNSYAQLTSLAAVPAAFAESAFNGNLINIESPSTTEFFYGRFVDGSTTVVNLYRSSQNSTSQPASIGTATAATVTVRGQQILEISIPSALRTTYNLTNNPIFAVVNGVVMQGVRSFAGVDQNKGGSMLNEIAINHVKANVNFAAAKPAVAKSISKALLGM